MTINPPGQKFADLMEPPGSLNWDAPEFVRGAQEIQVHKDAILMKESRRAPMLAHFEAAANSILGIVLAQLVLFAFGLPLHEALALNAVMIGVSYARSFVLRVVFARWAR